MVRAIHDEIGADVKILDSTQSRVAIIPALAHPCALGLTASNCSHDCNQWTDHGRKKYLKRGSRKGSLCGV
jgi:hypothetical protein